MSISGPSETLVPETKEGIKKKILIVEDDNSFSSRLERWMTGFGYQVYTATNEQEALEMLKTHNPDLVTLDGNFPKTRNGEIIETLGLETAVTMEKIRPELIITMISSSSLKYKERGISKNTVLSTATGLKDHLESLFKETL